MIIVSTFFFVMIVLIIFLPLVIRLSKGIWKNYVANPTKHWWVEVIEACHAQV
jgi:hypothetical protein